MEIEQDVIVSAANNRHCFNISITDDTLPEENECFVLGLENIKAIEFNLSIYQLHSSAATVTILDNDGNF